MRSRRFLLFVAGLLCAGLAACSDPSPAGSAAVSTSDAASDSAYALLASLDRDAIAEAYARLDRAPHTAEIRLEALDAEGRVTAGGTRLITRRPSTDGVVETTSRVDTTGVFPGGGAWEDRLAVGNPLPRVLPDEPAFLERRARDQYVYATRKDTLAGGRRSRIVEARLRPDADGEQALTHARYLLAADSNAVLSVDVERASSSALFDETSRVQIHLGTDADGRAVPRLAVVETEVDVPGGEPLRLRLTQRIRPAAEASRRRARPARERAGSRGAGA